MLDNGSIQTRYHPEHEQDAHQNRAADKLYVTTYWSVMFGVQQFKQEAQVISEKRFYNGIFLDLWIRCFGVESFTL